MERSIDRGGIRKTCTRCGIPLDHLPTAYKVHVVGEGVVCFVCWLRGIPSQSAEQEEEPNPDEMTEDEWWDYNDWV